MCSAHTLWLACSDSLEAWYRGYAGVYCTTKHLAGMHTAPILALAHIPAIAGAHMAGIYTVDVKHDEPCSEVHLQVRVWEGHAHPSCR